MKKQTNKYDSDITSKLLDLMLIYEIEDSKRYIDLKKNEIDYHQMAKKDLEDMRPLTWRKKKIEELDKLIENVDNQIMECYKKIEEEINLINKMQSSINKKMI